MAGDKATVGSADIVEGLRRVGVREGDLIQVHSSLKSFGHVEGGPEAVVEACLRAVGAAGTLMMPTFNHGSRAAFEDEARTFDLRTTKSVNGAITEALRLRPGVHRSLHPSHPYVAAGPLAEWLTREHFELDCFDARSPLGKLCALDGWIVMLGCGIKACTATHVAQTIYNVPCLGQRANPWPVRDPHTEEVKRGLTVTWRDGPCPFEFEPVEAALRRDGALHETKIGDAQVLAFRGSDAIRVGLELCVAHCPTCPRRPRV